MLILSYRVLSIISMIFLVSFFINGLVYLILTRQYLDFVVLSTVCFIFPS